MQAIRFPIEVSSIIVDQEPLQGSDHRHERVGEFVAVQLSKDDEKQPTFLGLFLGELAFMEPIIEYYPLEKALHISWGSKNPAIFIFDLRTVVYGSEIKWSFIESQEQLCQITGANIQDVPYVKTFKELQIEEANIDLENIMYTIRRALGDYEMSAARENAERIMVVLSEDQRKQWMDIIDTAIAERWEELEELRPSREELDAGEIPF